MDSRVAETEQTAVRPPKRAACGTGKISNLHEEVLRILCLTDLTCIRPADTIRARSTHNSQRLADARRNYEQGSLERRARDRPRADSRESSTRRVANPARGDLAALVEVGT